MDVFYSDRERRLWLWTVAVLVAIYSTLGPARAIAETLRELNLLRVSIVGVTVLLLVLVVLRWWRSRPDWRDVVVALGVAFAYFMVAVRIETWEERTHLIEYCIVGGLVYETLVERVRNGGHVPWPAAFAVGLTALLGLVDEGIQALLPTRVFDIQDIGFNALAGFMAVSARLAIAPQKQPGWRMWFLWLMAAAIGWGDGVYRGWFDGSEPKTLERVPADLLAGYLGLVAGAMAMAVLQWLILRKQIDQAWRWIAATVGALILIAAAIFGGAAWNEAVAWYGGVSAFGILAGAGQWLVLRGQTQGAAWWLLASAVAWGAALPLGDAAGPPALGAIYGAITGSVLVWLLRNRSDRELSVPNAS